MHKFVISILFCICSVIGADWKFIGFKSGSTDLIFFDESSIEYLDNKNITNKK